MVTAISPDCIGSSRGAVWTRQLAWLQQNELWLDDADRNEQLRADLPEVFGMLDDPADDDLLLDSADDVTRRAFVHWIPLHSAVATKQTFSTADDVTRRAFLQWLPPSAANIRCRN
jgi:hypothetical protein